MQFQGHVRLSLTDNPVSAIHLVLDLVVDHVLRQTDDDFSHILAETCSVVNLKHLSFLCLVVNDRDCVRF